MGVLGDIYNVGKKGLVDYNPANPLAYYNIGKDASTGTVPWKPTSGVPIEQAVGAMDPANPHQTQQAAYEQAARDAQAMADLQWQRQMQGLQGALGHVGNSQSLWNSVYGGSPGGGVNNAPAPLLQMPARQEAKAAAGPGGVRLEDWLNAGRAPSLNEHLSGGPGLSDALRGVRPDPNAARPATPIMQPGTHDFVARPTMPSTPVGPQSGISQASSALTSTPPPRTDPVRTFGPAAGGLDSYFPQPAQSATPGIAPPPINSFVAPPAPPPPPPPAAAALPGLADFLPPQMAGGSAMTSLLRKPGWGGF